MEKRNNNVFVGEERKRRFKQFKGKCAGENEEAGGTIQSKGDIIQDYFEK